VTHPAWKIDDTSQPGRIFCEHLEYPRLIGELLPFEETPDEGDVFNAPGHQCLCRIRWLEGASVVVTPWELYDSLAAALESHQAAKDQKPVATRP
jgi:hypothetical protein